MPKFGLSGVQTGGGDSYDLLLVLLRKHEVLILPGSLYNSLACGLCGQLLFVP